MKIKDFKKGDIVKATKNSPGNKWQVEAVDMINNLIGIQCIVSVGLNTNVVSFFTQDIVDYYDFIRCEKCSCCGKEK